MASLALEFRPAVLDDAAFFADVYSAVHPAEPQDPAMLRYEWEHGYENWHDDRSVIHSGGLRIGFAQVEHPRWELAASRFAVGGGELLPARRHAQTLAAIFAELERRAAAAGARVLSTRSNDDDAPRLAALAARGFREDRRSKKWELDLVARRERLSAMREASRERMRSQTVQLLTLAEDTDPDRYRKLWRLSEEAREDIPSTLGTVEETLEDYMNWLRTPGMREDRVWIARRGDEILGVSVLEYPPVRGVVNTAWTATARASRGQGIARALKCETLAQAIELGIDRVRTGNDAKNDPILHLNEAMGYRVLITRIEFNKDL